MDSVYRGNFGRHSGVNREQRQSERIHFSELKPLADQFGIGLADWQLRGRSLLNRDVAGNYKFAHRSIMEYLFVKRVLDMTPAERPVVGWTDQMNRFLEEIILFKIDMNEKNLNLKGIISYELRSKAVKINNDSVIKMIRNFDFYDSGRNISGKGYTNKYLEWGKDEKVVFDLATGLMWQQSGSPKYMNYEKAINYFRELNQQKFAGYNDWRLPTIEEAMSLMEPKKNKNGLYINDKFVDKQKWIWTADEVPGEPLAWVVNFSNGYCDRDLVDSDDNFVRCVRSGQASGR
jgi:hypothetical protein